MKKEFLIIGLSLILFLTMTGCDVLLWTGSYDVKYVVTGTASTVNLTIENSSGGISQYSNNALPWEYDFSVSSSNSSYTFVYVSAQNNGASGSVTSDIYVKKSYEDDYSLFKTSTSNGSYVIATSSGSL